MGWESSQVNKRLSEELGQSHQQLGACLEQLQHLQGEHMVLGGRMQAPDAERTWLPGEKAVLPAALGVARAKRPVGDCSGPSSECPSQAGVGALLSQWVRWPSQQAVGQPLSPAG